MTDEEYVQIVEKHRPMMVRFARERLRLWKMSPEDAEDFVQQTLLDMWVYREHVTNMEYVTTLFNTALLARIKNACKRKALHIDPAARDLLYIGDQFLADPASVESPLRDAMELALEQIEDPTTRTAAWLVYACEFTVQEAAVIVGVGREVLYKRLQRAAPTLRVLLAPYLSQSHQSQLVYKEEPQGRE